MLKAFSRDSSSKEKRMSDKSIEDRLEEIEQRDAARQRRKRLSELREGMKKAAKLTTKLQRQYPGLLRLKGET
jgi:hypothetical protein